MSTEQTNQLPQEQTAPQTTEIAIQQELQLLQAKSDATFALTTVGQELKRFEMLQRIGKMYSTATVVPDTYKGNISNCAIALDMAMRMKANPLMVMQNLYMVHGTRMVEQVPNLHHQYLRTLHTASLREQRQAGR